MRKLAYLHEIKQNEKHPFIKNRKEKTLKGQEESKKRNIERKEKNKSLQDRLSLQPTASYSN